MEGEVADPSLVDGSREERRMELEKRLRQVRAQQLSLHEGGCGRIRPTALRDSTPVMLRPRGCWNVELERQIEYLSQREFGNRMLEFCSLKRREIWHASHYHQMIREQYERLVAKRQLGRW